MKQTEAVYEKWENGKKVVDSFVFEQHILRCWEITEDLDTLCDTDCDAEEIFNKVLAIKRVYDMRFDKLWEIYEEYHTQELANKKKGEANGMEL